MNESTKDTQIWICFLLLVNKSGAKAVNSQSWTFETNYTQKWHFYAVPGHKQQPDNQTIKFWHQVSKFRGGHNLLLTVGVFSNEREYSGADWLVPNPNGWEVMMFWRLVWKGSISKWINYKGVCRAAPATPGLLKTVGPYYNLLKESV